MLNIQGQDRFRADSIIVGRSVQFGIFIYDGVEPIDLATFGVLSMARRIAPQIAVCTIAPRAGAVALANGLTVIADFGIDDAPACDVVIVTGGPGWTAQANAPATLDFIRRVHASRRIASVCTGGMILAASGVLDGGPATTKRAVAPPESSPLEMMRATYPRIDVREAMLVEGAEGVVTGGGVTLCIDTTLHILANMLGERVADETARVMEYQRAWRANRESFAPVLSGRQA
jgi:transcriptional regulator GlxA family with amidase domain